MRRRDILAGLGGVVGGMLGPVGVACADDLVLPAECRQGDVIRGRATPGARIRVGPTGQPFAVAADGAFVVGVGRDHGPSLEIAALNGAAPIASKTVVVRPRSYLSVVISGTARSGADSASTAAPDEAFGDYYGEDLFDGGDPEIVRTPGERSVVAAPSPVIAESRRDRNNREAAAKAAAFRTVSSVEGHKQVFIRPVAGRVTSSWGAERIIETRAGERRPPKPHGGVDLRGLPGTPIKAPALGVVLLADPDFYYDGGIVLLDHGQGLISAYLHMSEVIASVGQTLTQGDVLGRIGQTGRAKGPHLCWRMKWRRIDVDPMSLLPEPER